MELTTVKEQLQTHLVFGYLVHTSFSNSLQTFHQCNQCVRPELILLLTIAKKGWRSIWEIHGFPNMTNLVS